MTAERIYGCSEGGRDGGGIGLIDEMEAVVKVFKYSKNLPSGSFPIHITLP